MSEFQGIEKISLVDFDNKIACTLFSSGCNFCCPFCHNAPLVFKREADIPFEDILLYLKRRVGVLQAVVITGGEPTLMTDLEEKIKKIKEFGYLIKLDTNGTNLSILKRLVENKLIDYVAMDIKNGPTKYLETSGIINLDMNKIYSSINYIMNCGIEYEFRTTLVKEFHQEEDIKEIGEMIKGTKKYYLQHFYNRDTCINNDLNEVEKEKALEYQELLKTYNVNASLRGY